MSHTSKLIKNYIEKVWNQHDSSCLSNFFNRNAKITVSANELKTPEELKSYVNKWLIGFPDLQIDILELDSLDNKIVMRWVMNAKQLGAFEQRAPSNKKIQMNGISCFQIENDLITELYQQQDELAIHKVINKFSDTIYLKSQFSNNFNGPAKKIYNTIYNFYPEHLSASSVMVNALREFIARVPENFSIDIPDLDRLMGEVDIQEIYIKKADRTIRALYYSTEKSRHSDAPVLTYLHGGGWVALAPENYDLVCRKFSLTSNINVICPDYRLLPEHPFPASFDDCYDTYLWLKETNDDLLFDRDKIFLGGDSAGGAMTASLIHRLHDEEKPLPIGILMLSPATDLDFQKYESFRKSAPRQLLLDPALAEFEAALYVPYEMKTHPYVSPVYGDLSYFPPTLVMNGQDDPLTDDASNFVQKLKDSGVSLVDFINCEGMPHVYHTNLGMCPESEAVYEDFDNFFKKCLN